MSTPTERNTTLVRVLPFLDWVREIRLSSLKSDILAGLTVSVVLIPQSMAYAMLAGLPPQLGLYAAVIAPVVAGLMGSLRQLATGPIAIMSLLVFTTLSEMATPGSQKFIELAFLLALMVGLVYLVIGYARLGLVMSFISNSTVKGFTASAALIIIATQLPHLMGVRLEGQEYFAFALVDLVSKLPDVNLPTLGVGVAAFAIIYGIKSYRKNFPAALVALVVTTAAVHFFDLDQRGVAVIGEIPAGLPSFHPPHIDVNLLTPLLGSAIVIALVSFAETYSVGKAISEQTKQKINVDQEFVGQGWANVIGSFFQCYPVSGSLSRTAMNHATGAKTGLSSVASSAVVVLALLFLTPLFSQIPKAALAALVMSAVLILFHPKQVFLLWKKNRDDGVVAVTVFLLALLIKPDYALLIGVITSLVLFLWKSMHPRIVPLTWDAEHKVYFNAETHHVPTCSQILVLRIDNSIYFANAEYTLEHIIEKLDAAPPGLRYLLLDFKAVSFIDLTGVDAFRSLHDELRRRDVALILISPHQPVRQVFESSGILADLGKNTTFDSYSQAMDVICDHIDHSTCDDGCPFAVLPECLERQHGANQHQNSRDS